MPPYFKTGIALYALTLAIAPAVAQEKLSLDKVFGSPGLSGPTAQSVKLSPNGTILTMVRSRPDDRARFDLWAMDTKTGAERMLVDSKEVGSGAELSEAEKMQRERDRSLTGKTGIVTYDWAPDGKSILVPLDGDLYLASLSGSGTSVRRLTDTPEGELNPAVSPKGGFVSFVRNQNLYVQSLSGKDATPLTTDGKDSVHWGEAEFVAQEEMDRRTGYWWSPTDDRIAVERFDEAQVGVVTRAAIGADGTKVYDQRYPAAGTPNALVELYVMNRDGSGRVKVDLGSNSDIYLARVNWAPDGKTLYVQRESRDQKLLDVLAVDPATGTSKILFSEKSGPKSWLNLNNGFRVMPDGSFIWESERDGFNHLYRLNKGKWTQLTKGPWVVTGLIGVDKAAGRLFFLGNKDDALERQLYSVDIAKPNVITRITEAGWWNDATMDDAASRVIVSRSNSQQPPQSYLADTGGKRISWILENKVAPGHPYYPFLAAHRPVQYGTFKANDGTTLYYEMITPDLVAGKRYPVFFSHYGGPGTGQQVTRGWMTPIAQYLASLGYIYFQIDNRGSYNRGKAFEDHIYHAMGTVEVDDQLAGAALLKTMNFVDPAKIVTYGWSYGGYMSLKLLEKSHGVFAAAIAGAPVTDWTLYDTHYTERYLGDPKVKDSAYPASGALVDATKISDPLLLVHGMSDDNVVLDNSTRFMTIMQKNAVPFELMLYPGQTHGVGAGQPGVSRHLWTTMLDFAGRYTGILPETAPPPASR